MILNVTGVCSWFSIAATLLLVGCVDVARYNSKDLTLLPCEGSATEFFLPVEFDENGHFIYLDQVDRIRNALRKVNQIYVFVHGWDKTTQTAEVDYQNLICRFHTHYRTGASYTEKAIVIGVFWPSIEFPRWLNFWKIRDRVDRIADRGFASLMEVISDISFETENPYRLAFIGHSFGGRMVVHGLQEYINKPTNRTFVFLSNLEQLQLVLLNAAVSEYTLLSGNRSLEKDLKMFKNTWSKEQFVQEMRVKYEGDFHVRDKLVDLNDIRVLWIPTLTQLAFYTDVRIYNVYSNHDAANRYLYPLGSITEDGGPACAIGACGLKQWKHSAKVEEGGTMIDPPDLKKSNVWNIDASDVITSHSDIYKGRVAGLLWELLSLKTPSFSDEELQFEEKADYRSIGWHLSNGPFWFEYMRRDHIDSMAVVNHFRRMSQKLKLEINRYHSLLFDLDSYITRHNWSAAEATLRSLAELTYCTPGWWWQLKAGLVDGGIFFDRSNLWIVRAKICGFPQLFYVWAVVNQKLGFCSEALRQVERARYYSMQMGTQHSTSIHTGWWRADPLYAIGEQFIYDACPMS
ncbi:MAG: hypothetical protein NW701_20310 [Nitrospira sp.]